MSNILSPEFDYVPSVRTDIRKTFERERERLARLAEAKKREPQQPALAVIRSNRQGPKR